SVWLWAADATKGDIRVSEEMMEYLLLCRWPGNVRQLQNEVRRLVALAEPNAVLTPDKLSGEVVNASVRLTDPSARPDTASGNRLAHGDQQMPEQQMIV